MTTPKGDIDVSLDDSAQKLAALSRQINDYTDRLNARLAEIEQTLRDAGLGFDLWLEPITARTPDGGKTTFRIGWTKWSDWGFHWDVPGDEQGGGELLGAPRWVRVAAFPQVGTLITRLTKIATETLNDLEPIAKMLPAAFDHGPPAPETVVSDEEDIPF